MAGTGRTVPRSRCVARRLDLGPGQTRRRGDCDRQGAARSRGCRAARRVVARRECVCSRTGKHRAGRLAVFRHHLLSRAVAAAVERWRASGLVRNFVCTLKFQGETDHELAEAFAALPGAQVLHLHHNKHEPTFMLTSEAPKQTPSSRPERRRRAGRTFLSSLQQKGPRLRSPSGSYARETEKTVRPERRPQ